MGLPFSELISLGEGRKLSDCSPHGGGKGRTPGRGELRTLVTGPQLVGAVPVRVAASGSFGQEADDPLRTTEDVLTELVGRLLHAVAVLLLLLDRRQAELLEHRVRAGLEILVVDEHGAVGVAQPLDRRELRPAAHLLDRRRDLALEHLADAIQRSGLVQGGAGVLHDQATNRVRVRRKHLDDEVETLRAQHALVDGGELVGGEDHHDLVALALDAVERVEDLVHLLVALGLDGLVDVFHEHERRLVLLRQHERLRQVLGVLEVDERPVVPDALLRRHRRREGLADAVLARQQGAALEGDAVLPAHVGVLDRDEDRRLDRLVEVVREDELRLVGLRGVDELRAVVDVERPGGDLLVGGELHLHGVAAVDAVRLDEVLGELRQLLDVPAEPLLHVAGEAQAGLAVLHLPGGVDVTVDAGDLDATPDDLGLLADADVDRDEARGLGAEERRSRHQIHPAELLLHRVLEGEEALVEERVDRDVDGDDALVLLLLPLEGLDALRAAHPLRQDDLLALANHDRVLEDLVAVVLDRPFDVRLLHAGRPLGLHFDCRVVSGFLRLLLRVFVCPFRTGILRVLLDPVEQVAEKEVRDLHRTTTRVLVEVHEDVVDVLALQEILDLLPLVLVGRHPHASEGLDDVISKEIIVEVELVLLLPRRRSRLLAPREPGRRPRMLPRSLDGFEPSEPAVHGQSRNELRVVPALVRPVALGGPVDGVICPVEEKVSGAGEAGTSGTLPLLDVVLDVLERVTPLRLHASCLVRPVRVPDFPLLAIVREVHLPPLLVVESQSP